MSRSFFAMVDRIQDGGVYVRAGAERGTGLVIKCPHPASAVVHEAAPGLAVVSYVSGHQRGVSRLLRTVRSAASRSGISVAMVRERDALPLPRARSIPLRSGLTVDIA